MNISNQVMALSRAFGRARRKKNCVWGTSLEPVSQTPPLLLCAVLVGGAAHYRQQGRYSAVDRVRIL